MTKRLLLCGGTAALLTLGAAGRPARAPKPVRESVCRQTVGTTVLTHDCKFAVRDYVAGTPVRLTVRYACRGRCGPVVGFGIRSGGFAPAGVTGRLLRGRRGDEALDLTFVVDALAPGGKRPAGEARLMISVGVEDGAGATRIVPCEIDVRLTE